MDLDSLRRFCLAFPHATEDMPWADDLCFKVGGKIFAGVNLGAPPHGISLKCSPERFAELEEREGMGPAPYVGRYKWIRIESISLIRDAELMELIRESYDLVSAKARPTKPRISTLPKKKKKRAAKRSR